MSFLNLILLKLTLGFIFANGMLELLNLAIAFLDCVKKMAILTPLCQIMSSAKLDAVLDGFADSIP
jgi:hypothetical protein